MAAFVRLAFTAATKLDSFSEINLKLPLTHDPVPIMVCINIHTDSTNISIKNKGLARSAPQHLLPLPHLLIVLMAQGAQVGERRDKQQQHVNNAKGGCSSPFTRSQKKALESLGLITYNDELLCVDINKASQLAGLM